MRQELEVNGRVRHLSVRRADDRYVVQVDGREWIVDALRAGAHALSLLISERRHRGEAGEERGRPDPGQTFSYEVVVVPSGVRQSSVYVGATGLEVSLGRARRRQTSDDLHPAQGGPHQVVAPMPGRVVRLMVRPGDKVRAHQPVAIVEAMKMENELKATHEGVVLGVPVQVGQLVETGAVLAIVGDDR